MAFKELGDTIPNQDLPEEYLVIKNKGDEICSNYKNRTLNLKIIDNQLNNYFLIKKFFLLILINQMK